MSKEWVVMASDDAIEALADSIQAGPIINEQGQRVLTEETVGNLNGLKIEIFAREHPPPHFRVLYAGETANFSISDCSKLNGGLAKWEKNIKEWHSNNKQKLINVWNKTRPSDCPVGEYRE
jgi:hypothetical protein